METRANRLRQACNSCHSSKVRCSGGEPCERCRNSGLTCQYSYMSKLGKPKGSRNRKTLEKAAARSSNREAGTSNTEHVATATIISPRVDREASFSETSGWRPVDMSNFDAWMVNETQEYQEGYDMMSTSHSPAFPPRSAKTNSSSTDWDDSMWYLDGISSRAQPSMIGSDDFELDDYTAPSNSDQRALTSMPNLLDQSYHPLDEQFMNTLVPSIQALEPAQRNGDRKTCGCLRTLADLLCHLNTTENNNESMAIATILAEADATRKCVETVLECDCCRLDMKVAMLMTTVLQTALDWLNTSQRGNMRDAPKVQFGDWTIPESDAMAVRKFLTYRILTTSDAVVGDLRLRIDEITVIASKSGKSSKFMDTKYLQQALRWLAESLKELLQHARS